MGRAIQLLVVGLDHYWPILEQFKKRGDLTISLVTLDRYRIRWMFLTQRWQQMDHFDV